MNEKDKNRFKFSVVIPVYNAEKFLRETIESVIKQDIGFEENIQLILVNDGSKDESEAICIEYRERYPKNVIYVYQDNAGVSVARNRGKQYIEGKYVNFLDSDDVWDLDAFSKVFNFFEKRCEEVDLVACRMRFFEARTDYHPLDYRFKDKKNRIINILNEVTSIQMHVTSCFIKGDVAKKYFFNEDQRYGEDTVYVNEIIIARGKYGVLCNVECHYRKRKDGSSAIQGQFSKKEWYLKTVESFYQRLIEFSRERFDSVIPYVQQILVYDIRSRLTVPYNYTLSEIEYADYLKQLKLILSEVEDDSIIISKPLSVTDKIHMLKFKSGCLDASKFKLAENILLYQNRPFFGFLDNGSLLRVNFLSVENDCMVLKGVIQNWVFDCLKGVKLLYTVDEQFYYPVTYAESGLELKRLADGEAWTYRFYEVRIPMTGKTMRVFPMIQLSDGSDCRLKMTFAKFVPLAPGNPGLTYSSGKYVIRTVSQCLEVMVPTNHLKTFLAYEWKALKYLIKKKRLDMAWLRMTTILCRKFKKKKIWLISDREYVANDNGEYFFRYMQEHKRDYPGIKTYFVIASDSPDYIRMKKYGPIVALGSRKHKKLYMLCDWIVSSSANEVVFDFFKKDKNLIKSEFHYKYAFLQHGIIKNDLSGWLNKVNKNISIFVTSAKQEYESIRYGRYFYDNQVKLTGLARFDYLVERSKNEKTEKLIVILPTWRRYIKDSYDDATSKSIYSPTFKNTAYYRFYQELIKNEVLLNVMREYGYKGLLGMHPVHSEQAVDFEGNDVFDICKGYLDYQDLFVRGQIMVTDYSSTFFDFCYLRKPVVYAQFDREEFYSGQIFEEGYFDDERDGFGPVCKDLESTVEALVKIIENKGKLSPEYERRIVDFYAFNDQNNCKRIADAIIEADG